MKGASAFSWLLLGLLGLGLASWGGSAGASQNLLDSLNSETARIVQQVRPSLVAVESYYKRSSSMSIHAAVATGILYSHDGYIITIGTLVRPDRTYRIRDHSGKVYRGTLIGTDGETNLAVMKIEATDLTPAKFSGSQDVKEGSWVAVLADAYGLPSSVGLGFFNGRRSSDGLLQLTMNLSPLSIGGAVVNARGEVIGILTAKGSEVVSLGSRAWSTLQMGESFRRGAEVSNPGKEASSAPGGSPSVSTYHFALPSSGVGLALPSEVVEEVAEELIRFGEVRRGFLGISQMNIAPEQKRRLGLKWGVVVTTVAEGSPAETGGLRSGDILTRFDDKPVQGTRQLFNSVRSSKPGKEVSLTVLRGSEPQRLTVLLGQLPETYRNQEETINLPDWFLFEPDLGAAAALEDKVNSENQQLRRQVEYLREQLLEIQKELKEVKSQLDSGAGDLLQDSGSEIPSDSLE